MNSVKQALLKKAEGYFYDEIVSEMGFDELSNQMIIVKQKITKKHVPPDTTAAKMLLDNSENTPLLETKDKEELENERQKMMKLLRENDNEK